MFTPSDTVVVISDLHIGSKWFHPERERSLAGFMEYLWKEKEAGKLQGLIILGDAFETWSIDERYRTDIEWLKKKSQFFLDGVNKLTKPGKYPPVQIAYVMGNHDSILAETNMRGELPVLQQFFAPTPVLICPADIPFRMRCGTATVLMEHGHRYDLFNSFLPTRKIIEDQKLNTPEAEKQPPGYFLTRVDYRLGIDQTEPWWLGLISKLTGLLQPSWFGSIVVGQLSDRKVDLNAKLLLPDNKTYCKIVRFSSLRSRSLRRPHRPLIQKFVQSLN